MKWTPWGLVALLGPLMLARPALASDPPNVNAHWPQWRGPNGDGVALTAAPIDWSLTENVKWRAPIAGRGFSTPIVWGDRIFLTTAIPTNEAPEAGIGADESPFGTDRRGGNQRRGGGRRGGGGGRGGAPQAEHSFDVIALDRATGEPVWRKTAKVATPHEGHHDRYGSFASNAPVTDGERLYAFFGSRGLFCYDMNGELLWEKDFGVQMRIRLGFGEGVGPLLHDDRLILKFDHEGESFMVALDKRTGDEIWRVPRAEGTAWSQPIVAEHDGRKQIIVNATPTARAYDFATGEEIWSLSGFGPNAIPMPVLYRDMVYLMTGFQTPRPLMAVRLGRTGDLTGADAVVWRTDQGTSYTPSPVLHDGKIYFLTDNAMISCLDAATGVAHYQQERLPGSHQFKASPIAAGEHLYLASERGAVLVLKLGPTFEVAAVNEMAGEFFVASPIVAEGELFLRSANAVFCIGEANGR
jgi:outer membrane protein assembly factor BamB